MGQGRNSLLYFLSSMIRCTRRADVPEACQEHAAPGGRDHVLKRMRARYGNGLDAALLDTHRFAQRGPDLRIQDEIGVGVEVRRVAIDDNQGRAVLLGHDREARGRINDE